eukprot:1066946_1
MATIYLLLLVLHVAVYIKASILSFGLNTAGDITLSEVALQLHWGHEIYECSIRPNTSYTPYICFANASSTQSWSPSGISRQYFIQITNKHADAFDVDSVFVTDDSHNQYTMNEFCVPQSLVSPLLFSKSYLISLNHYIRDICEGVGLVSLNGFGLDSDQHKIVSVMAHFRGNLAHYATTSGYSGYITSSNVYKFGITTAPDSASTEVTLTLHWNLQIIQCTIYPSTSNTEHLCYVNDITTTTCFNRNGYKNMYQLHIDHDDSDTLQIDSIVVYDETYSYYYGIKSFCIDINSSKSGRGSLIDNNCSTPSQFLFFEDICLDNSNCSAHIDVSFGTDVFQNPNSFGKTYGVVTTGVDASGVTCAPTTQPTAEPTMEPTSTPEWRWIDNTTPLYYNWMPSIEHSFESCAIASIFGHWDERYCHERYPYPFFCNNPTIANPTPSPTQTPTTLPDMPVNNTAQYTSDMNYIRGWMGVTTWLEANEYCRSQYGTSLATITSAKENTEITYSSGLQYTIGATPTTCSFIGLHRMHSMIDWDWIDGTGLNYTHWASGNTSSDTKLCSFMCGYGTWYTTSCTEEDDHAFVCNSPKHVTTAQPTLPPNTESTVSPDAMLTTFAWNSNETGKGDKKTDNAILIVFVVATCVFAIALCAVSCVCYKRNKLLADAVGVGQVQQETQVMVQRVRANTDDESD